MLPRTPLDLKRALRRAELEQIETFVSSPGERTLVILGPSGIGKSTLLGCFAAEHGDHIKARLDLGAPLNRSALGVAASLLTGLNTSATESFFKVASEARLAQDERLTRNALTVCEQLFPELVESEDVVLLDNVDKASARVRSWLFASVFREVRGHVVAAARSLPTEVADASTVDILRFGRERLRTLAESWSEHIALPADRVLDQLARLSNGHPVHAELVGWALSLLSTSSEMTRIDLSELLLEAWHSLPASDQASVGAAIPARHRVNDAILGEIAPEGRLGAVADLPFASQIEDAAGGWIVHPVALDRLAKALAIEPPLIEQRRRVLTERVYPRLLTSNLSSDVRAALELERLRYLASLPSSNGFAAIEQAFRLALHDGKMWRADEVSQIALEALESPLGSLKMRSALVVIENSIAHHYVAEAQEHISRISASEVSRAAAPVRVRIQLLRAKCVTSPAATSGREIFSVSAALEATLEDSLQLKGDHCLTEEIRLELGHAYRLAARYEDALRCFADTEKHASNAAVRIRSIEEQGQLYRHMQDLPTAEAFQARAALMRVDSDQKISGHGLFCLATLRRDQNDFLSADRLYGKALSLALDECDDYLVCNIKGDMAWMKFLDGDLAASRELLGEYERLARFYNFSRELAECWHMRFHLEAEAQNWPAAYRNLDTALQLANDFGNVVMQLDCLMHKVQQAVREERVDDADAIIAEMSRIEDCGCGIRVFRGRARIYQGDGFYTARRERDSGLAWREGFEIVALHGQSRSNVELLSNLIAERRDRFFAVLERFSDIAPEWPNACAPTVRSRIEDALGT
jgi:tetratricopeptide (TPR) repeat protein